MVKYKFELVGKEEEIVEISEEELKKAEKENICEEELVNFMFADWIIDKEMGKARCLKL